jgi:secreted trypsin-like serine protease
MKRHLCIAALVAMGLSGCAPDAEEASPEALGQDAREIVGGSWAWPHGYRWQARILLNNEFNCGGTLIRPNWVLTAGHCVYGTSASQLKVILGDHRQDIVDYGFEQHRAASRYILHPSYVHSTAQNDIALIELATPAVINDYVGTIRLETNESIGPRNDTLVTGWGRTSANGSPSDVLQYAAAPVQHNSVCNTAFAPLTLSANQICAGFSGTNPTGPCVGDSGGPLFSIGGTEGVMEQLGIVSFGRTACDSYAVYTRVYPYKPWIEGHVRKQVRIGWAGNLSNGSITLRCVGTGEVVTASLSQNGASAELNCPSSTVEATCNTSQYIDTLERTANGALTYVVSSGYPSTATDTFATSASGKVDYLCRITD